MQHVQATKNSEVQYEVAGKDYIGKHGEASRTQLVHMPVYRSLGIAVN